ncbi:MAG: GNAT family N-acetyltransferase [Gemmatimonadales bacterium]
MNKTPAEFEIRALEDAADLRTCVALQHETWGSDFGEQVPPALLKVVQKIGGVVAGAFDSGGSLVGFVFGLTGLRDGRPAHWSHMLAVRNEYRDRGLGRMLKEYQKQRVLAIGVETMLWTFDPLVARNAHLNLNRLGVSIEDYVEDMYPGDERGTLDAVIGTDRFVVRWNLVSPVQRTEVIPLPECSVNSAGHRPTDPDLTPRDTIHVEVPPDIHAVKREAPDLARAWRRTSRAAFRHFLAEGYVIQGFGREADRCMYRLVRE